MTEPLVSVVMPVRNEEQFLESALAGVLATRALSIEVLVIDGRSTDGTVEVARRVAAADPRVRLMDNPAKVAATALNLAIAAARGEIIVRLDGHSRVDASFVPILVAHLLRSGAANTGGVWVTLPGAATAEAEAIALVLSSPYGVGGATYRTGATAPTWVDTVPFGCWKRATLLGLGGFDETVGRNEDDELNGRILANGGRILLVPEVRINYYARSTLARLGQMYFQYGWFKPLVLRKARRAFTLRQFAPPLAVLGLLGGAAWSLLAADPWMWLGLVPWVAYSLYLTVATVLLMQGKSVRLWPWVPAVLATIHLSNGAGFLRGMLDFLLFRRDQGGGVMVDLPLTR
jgi:glycosyltransferase involved in cell wall biosynthesis